MPNRGVGNAEFFFGPQFLAAYIAGMPSNSLSFLHITIHADIASRQYHMQSPVI
jgi:hypothetical protein